MPNTKRLQLISQGLYNVITVGNVGNRFICCSLREVRISVCFQSKGGAGLPVLAARKMELEPPIPALLLSPFSRGLTSLTLVPRSLLRNRTETFARQAYAGYVCCT